MKNKTREEILRILFTILGGSENNIRCAEKLLKLFDQESEATFQAGRELKKIHEKNGEVYAFENLYKNYEQYKNERDSKA